MGKHSDNEENRKREEIYRERVKKFEEERQKRLEEDRERRKRLNDPRDTTPPKGWRGWFK